MGFIKEVYSDNRAGLVVAFGRGNSSATYFDGDSAEEAMKHFNIYLKGYEMYIKTEDEVAINNLGINAADAVEFRSTVNAIIETLTDEQAIAAPVLFPVWQPNVAYKVGERIRYEGKLYKVVQDHTSQEDWVPLHSASLYAALLTDEENNAILVWVQPDSTNGYSINDKVIHAGQYWISLADNNVWEPDAVNAPWAEYIADWTSGVAYGLNQKVYFNETTYISLVEKNTELPADSTNWKVVITEIPQPEEPSDQVIQEWLPSDKGGIYMIGDKVLYEEQVWESLIDNNVWSPVDYPAGWSEIAID